jgi:hypothetical protein
MRCLPASELKKPRHRRGPPTNPYPREGTQLRRLFDALMASKGAVADLPFPIRSGRRRMLVDLTDYYGLDIRHPSRGKYVLAGEWIGKVYVDYIAERLHAAERAS